MHYLSWLTSLVNLFLLNLTPPLILLPEMFPPPYLVALSTTRIGQTVKMTYLSVVRTRDCCKSYINIVNLTFL